MTLSFPSILMFVGIFQLALAAMNVPAFSRWSWLAGGALFIALSLFVNVAGR